MAEATVLKQLRRENFQDIDDRILWEAINNAVGDDEKKRQLVLKSAAAIEPTIIHQAIRQHGKDDLQSILLTWIDLREESAEQAAQALINSMRNLGSSLHPLARDISSGLWADPAPPAGQLVGPQQGPTTGDMKLISGANVEDHKVPLVVGNITDSNVEVRIRIVKVDNADMSENFWQAIRMIGPTWIRLFWNRNSNTWESKRILLSATSQAIISLNPARL